MNNEKNNVEIKTYYRDLSKPLKVVLKEMCKRVGAPYTKINFAAEDWFRYYSWTEKEQDDFIKWLSDYVYKGNAEIRYELLGNNIKSRIMADRFANSFVFDYGWTLKPTDNLGIR